MLSSCLFSFQHCWNLLWGGLPSAGLLSVAMCDLWMLRPHKRLPLCVSWSLILFYQGNRWSVSLDPNSPVRTQPCPVCSMGVSHGVLCVLSKYRQTTFPECSSSSLLFTLFENLITRMTFLQERVCGDYLLCLLLLWGFEMIPQSSFHSSLREQTTPLLERWVTIILFVKMNSFWLFGCLEW